MMTHRRAGALAAFAFVLLCAVSVDACREALRLQSWQDRSHALNAVQRVLSPAAGVRDSQAVLNRLLQDPTLGFRFLALRDSRGRVEAVAGRYERWAFPGLTADLAAQLRELRYALVSTHEILALTPGPESRTLEFALGTPEQRAWSDETLSRLLRFSVLGILLAAAGLMALIIFWLRHQPVRARRLRESQALPLNESADPDLLDQAQMGLLQLDRGLRVRVLNKTAASLTGWPAPSALDQQVFSVVRLRADDGHPMDSELAKVWSRHVAGPIQLEGWLESRHGSRHRVELTAATMRDSGGVTGGILLLQDVTRRHTEAQQTALAARLPLSLMDRLEDGVLYTDRAGVIGYANRRIFDLLGYTPEDLKGEAIGKLLPVPFLNQPELRLLDYANGAAGLPPVRACHKQGQQVAVQLTVEAQPSEQGLLVTLRPRKD